MLAELLGIEGPTASARLTGAPTAGGWAAADGDVATAWITPFNRVNGSALNASLIAPGEPMTIRQRLGNYTADHCGDDDAGRPDGARADARAGRRR